MRLTPDDDFDDDVDDRDDRDDGDDLEDEFPLGDGTVDTDAMVVCPYCGEPVDIALDPAGGTDQRYEEDCEVCCQPWQVHVTYDREGHAAVSVTALEA